LLELPSILATIWARSEETRVGQVVGWAGPPTGVTHAFLFTDGQMYGLNDLIDPALHLTLVEANAINNQARS